MKRSASDEPPRTIRSRGSAQSADGFEELRREVWERTREVTRARVHVLHRLVSSLQSGTITDAEVTAAADEAHKLAGSLGTLGFENAFQEARTVEQILKSGDTAGLIERKQDLLAAVKRLQKEMPD